MAMIKDEQTAKDFLRVDQTDAPKKEVAARFGLTPPDVSKERKRWAHLLSSGNGNGKAEARKAASAPKAKAKPRAKPTPKAPSAPTMIIGHKRMIVELKKERKRLDSVIAQLEAI